MKRNKIIITKDETLINDYLDNDWIVKSVTAQHFSYTTSVTITHLEEGNFCFLLEKDE